VIASFPISAVLLLYKICDSNLNSNQTVAE